MKAEDKPGATTPPASILFDPVFGARLFQEVQAEGLRAAGALVERLVHLVDGSATNATSDREADSADESPAPAATEPEFAAVLPWLEMWRDLADRSSDALQRFQGAGRGPAGEGVQVGIDGSLAPTYPLVIAADTVGHGQGEMWLHNGTASDPGELIPHCGPLSDEYGATLACEAEIEPPKIDALPARSSRGFVISIHVDPSSAPGTYRGIVQVRGASAVWMPLEVVVAARSS